MDCSPLGTSVRGTFQAKILGWVAISSSRESSPPRDRTCVSRQGYHLLNDPMTEYTKGLEPGVVYHWHLVQVLSESDRFYLQKAFLVCLCFSIFTNFASSKPPSPLAWATNQFLTSFPISTLALMVHPAPSHQSSLQNVTWNCVLLCLKLSGGIPFLVAVVSQVLRDLAPAAPLTSPGAVLSHWPPGGCWKNQLSPTSWPCH